MPYILYNSVNAVEINDNFYSVEVVVAIII